MAQQPQPLPVTGGQLNDVIESGLKYCNYSSIFINIIVSLMCIISLILLNNNTGLYGPVEGEVVSLVNDECKEREEIVSQKGGSVKIIKYVCDLTIKYTVRGAEYQQSMVTETETQHRVGDKIDIEYLKTNTSVIRPKVSHIINILIIIAVGVLIITVLSTLVRIFLSDRKLVKWWIGFTCFKGITSSSGSFVE